MLTQTSTFLTDWLSFVTSFLTAMALSWANVFIAIINAVVQTFIATGFFFTHTIYDIWNWSMNILNYTIRFYNSYLYINYYLGILVWFLL